MFDEIIVGLILLAAPGPIWLAYNHPKAFEAFNRVVMIAGSVALAIYTAWIYAILIIRHEIVMALLESGNRDAADIAQAIRASAYEEHRTVIYAVLVAIVFMAALNTWVTKLKAPPASENGGS